MNREKDYYIFHHHFCHHLYILVGIGTADKSEYDPFLARPVSFSFHSRWFRADDCRYFGVA